MDSPCARFIPLIKVSLGKPMAKANGPETRHVQIGSIAKALRFLQQFQSRRAQMHLFPHLAPFEIGTQESR